MSNRVLLLNASYQPLRIIGLPRAVMLMYSERARLVESTGQVLRSPSLTIEHPSVVALNRQVKVPTSTVGFTRKGVLVRDRHQCAYCEGKARTIDHVVPQSKGGPNSWENCVAACFDCNNLKGDQALADLGWVLPFTPKAPSVGLSPFLWLDNTPEMWRAYLEPHLPRWNRPVSIPA